MRKSLSRLWYGLLSAMLLFVLLSVPVAAAGQYTIDDGNMVPIPDSYTYAYTINTLENAPENTTLTFNQPADIFMDKQDVLYVVDSKNNRLVKMDVTGSVQLIIKEANGKRFNGPQGVSVTENGDIYLADTGNGRIVQMASDGTFIREYGKPDSTKLVDITNYTPTKIVRSEADVMYVLMGENIMSLDTENNFRGYIGQTEIGYNFLESLLRLIASKEQQLAAGKRLASSYTNMTLGNQGFIYSTSLDAELGQIKVLNSVGTNIYKQAGSVATRSTVGEYFKKLINGNIISKSFEFAETVRIDGKLAAPSLADVAVDDNGMLTVVDRQTCRIYQYDPAGNLLAAFGKPGTKRGDFSIPVSIEVDSQGNLYVLDLGYGNIQVFQPTTFIKLVHQAVLAYNSGEYTQANELWQSVLEIDETYPLAHLGIGNVALKSEDYKTAMQSYATYDDRSLYSTAFTEQRYLFMQEHFFLIVLAMFALAAAVVWTVSRLYRRSKRVMEDFDYMRIPKLNCRTGLWVACQMQFHPAHTLESLRTSRKRLTYISGCVILFAVILARIIHIYGVGYIFQDIELANVNLTLEIAKYLIPFFSWLLTTYLIGSQFGGESTALELFFGYSAAMMPLAFVTPVLTLLSHCLGLDERVLFASISYLSIIWMVLMMVRALHTLNNFTIGRTVLVSCVSLLATVLLWFVVILGYTLVGRIFQFVQDLIQESVLVLF